ncbi:hypothetical protein [Paenibacillus bovis]|uniref:hypothetical protein n=1 Tax=Paenibacillus bovis TaxID=1616788 RepID=UPI001314EE35|nr:hypothetical protein [Paenibacillus bovis]
MVAVIHFIEQAELILYYSTAAALLPAFYGKSHPGIIRQSYMITRTGASEHYFVRSPVGERDFMFCCCSFTGKGRSSQTGLFIAWEICLQTHVLFYIIGDFCYTFYMFYFILCKCTIEIGNLDIDL